MNHFFRNPDSREQDATSQLIENWSARDFPTRACAIPDFVYNRDASSVRLGQVINDAISPVE